MMFGRRDVFEYASCERCKSVQICEVPANLGDYYPADYYSLGTHRERMQASAAERVKRGLKWLRFRTAYRKPAVLRRGLRRIWGEPEYARWLHAAGARLDSAILDVGCGSGYLLRQLHTVGFRQLVGADPFLAADGEAAPGVPLQKRTIQDVEGTFDVVLFNHSLEHVPDPFTALAAAAERLKPGGHVVVRLPVAHSYAHRTYGPDWVQLDAPRHLAIPSREGMKSLAQRVGLKTRNIIFESNAFQFWGSEQYQRGIPLNSERSYGVNPARSSFSPPDIARFAAHAERLDDQRDGDTACFVLQRAS